MIPKWLAPWPAALLLATLGCSADRPFLAVEVQTDLVPGVEFSIVRTEIFPRMPASQSDAEPGRVADYPVREGADLSRLVRVAELEDPEISTPAYVAERYFLRIRLLDDRRVPVAERIVVVPAGDRRVALRLTRTCLGVVCDPRDGDVFLACVGGQCAPATCSLSRPDTCPAPDCSVDEDCAEGMAACALGSCEAGLCMANALAGVCEEGLFCRASEGCVPLPTQFELSVDYRAYGGPGHDLAVAVAPATGDGLFVTGWHQGRIDFGDGDVASLGATDIFLSRLNAYNEPVWTRSFGGEGDDSVLALAALPQGGAVIAGAFQGDLTFDQTWFGAGGYDGFVASIDGAGEVRWSHRFGGEGRDVAASVAVDAEGHIYVLGSFTGTVTLAGRSFSSIGEEDLLLARLTPEGELDWGRSLGGSGVEQANWMALDPSGDLVISGHFERSASFGFGVLSSVGSWDGFVARLTSEGDGVWSRRFGGRGFDSVTSVAVAPDTGQTVVVGTFTESVDFGAGPVTSQGVSDIFVASLDRGGAPVWTRAYGSSRTDAASAVSVTDGGEVVVTGSFSLTVDFGGGQLSSLGNQDIFLLGLHADGSHHFSRAYGGVLADAGFAVLTRSLGRIALAGWMGGPAELAGVSVMGAGGADALLLLLEP